MKDESCKIKKLIKAYWDKEPGADDKLYEYFSPEIKGISYKIFNRNRDLSYDIDDYIQVGYISLFEACDSYKKNGFPENIGAWIYISIKYGILRWRKKIKNKHGAIIQSFDKPNENNYNLTDLIADDNAQTPFELVEKAIDNNIVRKELNNVLATKFDKLSSEIIKMKYGWDDYPRSDDYIANELNIGSDKVAAIHVEAICKFRRMKWIKEVGCIYLYGYKIKNIKKDNDYQENRRSNDLKFYSDLLNKKVKELQENHIKSNWGL